jgi:hypothetical protein
MTDDRKPPALVTLWHGATRLDQVPGSVKTRITFQDKSTADVLGLSLEPKNVVRIITAAKRPLDQARLFTNHNNERVDA